MFSLLPCPRCCLALTAALLSLLPCPHCCLALTAALPSLLPCLLAALPSLLPCPPVAEYVALAALTKQLIFIYQLLQTIGVDVILPMKIFEDNKGAVCISKNAASQKKTRAIEIRYHFVRDYQQDGFIEVIQCPTADMQADMMTKTLRRPEHVRQTERTMSECEPLPTQSI